MNIKAWTMLLFIQCLSTSIHSQEPLNQNGIVWNLTNRNSIVYYLDSTKNLPHQDNIEMSGKKVSTILYYEIDESGKLTISKDLIFPQLRTFNKSNEPDWKKYRAYFRKKINENNHQPQISLNEIDIIPEELDSIEINGVITFYYKPLNGLSIKRTLYPSMQHRNFIDEWTINNHGDKTLHLTISEVNFSKKEEGYKGVYSFHIYTEGAGKYALKPGDNIKYAVHSCASLNQEPTRFSFLEEWESRVNFLDTCKTNLVFNSPDKVLNTLFYFSKIRAAESIFSSSMGLIHSPGGGNYYVGIWANDQVEYSGPFFPFMGYHTAKKAAYNTYLKFLQHIPSDGGHIPYAFEVDGNFPMTHLDRGDAAMIAYGTSLYLLNAQDKEEAQHLWPLIEWSLDYCERMKNEYGAVKSESDEMEGRIETGEANLSTTTLYYGGLLYGEIVATELGKNKLAKKYKKDRFVIKQVIENYFGAEMEGLKTYKYYNQNKYLRHWICLPLTMGINDRKEGTVQALFHKLWTDNGVLVEYNPDQKEEQMFWDRATLYALRGALKAGEIDLGVEKLKAYSSKRLLGDHVPYPIEAYPENNMKHLSAESALYARIFIEGLFGYDPSGFGSFKLTPYLPKEWEYMELKNLFFGEDLINLRIEKDGKDYKLKVSSQHKFQFPNKIIPGSTIDIKRV